MKVGDKVRWTSQSAGSTTTKEGVVFAVVPKFKYLTDIEAVDMAQHNLGPVRSALTYYICNRSHESYLVSVPSNGKAKPKLYWPDANRLECVE